MNLVDYLLTSRVKRREFARDVGVSESYISLLISGKRRPSVSVALQIERITGGEVSAINLLGLNNISTNKSQEKK